MRANLARATPAVKVTMSPLDAEAAELCLFDDTDVVVSAARARNGSTGGRRTARGASTSQRATEGGSRRVTTGSITASTLEARRGAQRGVAALERVGSFVREPCERLGAL